MGTTGTNPEKEKLAEETLLFTEDFFAPETFVALDELRPSSKLGTIFEDCHNYIYANEGLLKERIFHEMVKLLLMKLYDEQNTTDGLMKFCITSSEYRDVIAGEQNRFEKRMHELFVVVKNKYSHLFTDNSLKLKTTTLAYVVKRLQYLSLTKTRGDVKGEAFQAFVYRHQRGDRGEFFTPHPIVKLGVKMIAPTPDERIIDPACGSGGFLIETISHVEENFVGINKGRYIQRQVRGIEFNPDIAISAMLRIAFEGGTGTEITCANALAKNEEFDNAFDVVVTNPPFGSRGKVKDRSILAHYLLARRWHQANDGFWKPGRTVLAGQSPEILFIEKCLKLLRPGGRMAIVLPDGLLQNMSNNHIRFFIRSQSIVQGIVSIPQEAFVPYGTGIKTSLLLLQKLPGTSNFGCFMARIRKVGYDVKGQPIYKRDTSGRPIKTQDGNYLLDDDIEEIASAYKTCREHRTELRETDSIYVVAENLLNSRMDVEHYQPMDHDLIEHLKNCGSKPLGDLADILRDSAHFRKGNEEIRYIAISNVDARTMQVVSQQVTKAHDAPSRATYRVRKGDIITAVSGASTGTRRHATALITEEEDGAICSNGFAVLRDIRRVDPYYLLAFMRTDYFLRQVRRLMTGHAIPAVSTEDLSTVLIPIPPKETQREIAIAIERIQTMRKEAMRIGENAVSIIEGLIEQGGEDSVA